MQFILDRLKEPSTWAAIASALTGAATYLASNGAPSAAVWVAAVGAGVSAVAGVVAKETGHA